MNIKISYLLDHDILLKRFLREHSNYYKELIRNPLFINELIVLMKKEYHLTLPEKLDKIKSNISLVNTFMDVLWECIELFCDYTFNTNMMKICTPNILWVRP